MGYIDEHNDGLNGGAMPLEALDRELADLKATLADLGDDAMKEEEHLPSAQTDRQEEPIPDPITEKNIPLSEVQPDPEPAQPQIEIPEEIDLSANTGEITVPPRKGGKAPVIAAIVIVAVVAAAAALFLWGPLKPQGDGSTAPTASGEVVTISDSVMGDVELQTVKGAKVNTYDEANLVTEDNGYLAYYEDGKKISTLGIDLSEYQKDIDFNKVKAAGVDFVMLRVGGRYYSDEGAIYEDSAFGDYYDQAKAAGLKVGAYFFSQAASVDDAVEEAQFILDKLDGRALDYPVAFDWETIEDDTARTDTVTGEILTDMAEAFCDTVTAAGYKAIVYANTALMLHLYDFETMKDYDFWLADYRDFPNMYYRFDMWQYTTDGTVDGLDAAVDLNLCFVEY